MSDELKNVRTVVPEWSKVMADTVLVDLTVGRWRAQVQTDWQHLGLPAAAFKKAYTPGTRRLLPERVQKELGQLETLARELLDRFAFKTLFGRLLPKDKYFEFKRLLKEVPLSELRKRVMSGNIPSYVNRAIWDSTSLYDRWFQLAGELAGNRDLIVDEVADLYTDALENIWRRQNGFVGKDLGTAQEIELAVWLDDKKAGIVASVPTAQYIRNSFVLQWTLAEVQAPPEAVKQAKLTELNRKERELARKIRKTERESERLELEQQQVKVKLDQAIAEEAAKLAETEGARFGQAIGQIVEQVQGQVYEMVLDHLEYLDENDALHSRNVGRITGLVALVRDKLAGLTDDEKLRQACSDLERLAKSGLATKPDHAPIVKSKLRRIAIEMKHDLLVAGVPTRSSRKVDVPDSLDEINRARRRAREVAPLPLEGIEVKPITRQPRRVVDLEPAEV